MTRHSLEELSELKGFIGLALVDSDSGIALTSIGGNGIINMEIAAAGNTEVLLAKRRVADQLGIKNEIEDILITLKEQYHMIRPLNSNRLLFLYIALDRRQAHLPEARKRVLLFEKSLDFSYDSDHKL